MIDINLLRVDKGGNPELVRESQRKRGASVALVDEIIAMDREWVVLRFELDELNKALKAVQKTIGEKMKAKENADELLAEKAKLESEQAAKALAVDAKEEAWKSKLCTVGNLVHESVVSSCDEANNDLVRSWPSNFQPFRKPLSHDQVLQRIDGYEPERGAYVSGHRGYFLKNVGVRLNQALINYGLDFLAKRSFTLLHTPFMMKKEVMSKTAQLEEFDDQLYKVRQAACQAHS